MLPQLAQEASLMEAHAGTEHIVELLETTMTTTHMFLRFHLCQESCHGAPLPFTWLPKLLLYAFHFEELSHSGHI